MIRGLETMLKLPNLTPEDRETLELGIELVRISSEERLAAAQAIAEAMGNDA